MMKEMLYNEDGIAVQSRYAVCYFGYLFEGDRDGWNFHEMDTREDAFSLYDFYSQYPELHFAVIDYLYDVRFENDEWN